jgi:DNA-binding transcriptional regulator YiaG
MDEIGTHEWMSLEEAIKEDVGNAPERKRRFDDAGRRIDAAMEIAELRKSQNLNQTQFAAILRIEPKDVLRLENGNFTENPDEVIRWVKGKIEQWNEVTSEQILSSKTRDKTSAKSCA